MSEDIFNNPIYTQNILTDIDLFTNLDKLELSKLFLKIYIRKYLHVLNKLQNRSKLFNKLLEAAEPGQEHLKKKLELSGRWHKHVKLLEPYTSTDVFLMTPPARKHCINNPGDESVPAVCEAMNNSIMKAALEDNIGPENIHYMLTLVSILYNISSTVDDITELNNIYKKVDEYKNDMIRGNTIDKIEFMKTTADIIKIFAEKSSKSASSTVRTVPPMVADLNVASSSLVSPAPGRQLRDRGTQSK